MNRHAKPKTESSGLTIGRLARAVGVNVETIRYYQRRGLISRPPRGNGGFRHYPAETAERLHFIKRAQQLGFQLKEIKELLALGEGHCDDVRARAEAKHTQIQAQIDDLTALRSTLDRLIRTCRTGASDTYCPIVESLSGRFGEKRPRRK
jgi:MerR family transcriptional regulator, mercuric resistance operon regulatory protein